MNEGTAAISLKAFWDAVEQRLAIYSVDDLREILRAIARETPPSGRQEFLEWLTIKPDAGVPSTDKISGDDLLSDIDDWIAEVRAQRQQAQQWEKRHGYDWDERYDDEDSLGPYAEFVEPLIKLFDRVEGAFDYGHIASARQAYHKLFTEALGLEDEYGRGVRIEDLSGLDVPKAYARYLRAVYESEPAPRRASVMLDQMVEMRTWLPRPAVNLDVIQVSPQSLPDQALFLQDWIAVLRQQGSSDADAWLREAIRLAQGRAGLEALARAEGLARPLAFLDWVAALESEQQPRAVIEAAQLALETFPSGLTLRAEIADYLCRAAGALNEVEILRVGRWQAFLAQPVLARLLDVWSATLDRASQTTAMQQAAKYVAGQLAGSHPEPGVSVAGHAAQGFTTSGWTDKGVLIHALLLAEEWGGAQELAAHEGASDWGSGDTAQGFAVPFLLTLLGSDPAGVLPANVTQIWREALQNTAVAGRWAGPQQIALAHRLEQVYRELIPGVSLDPDQTQQLLSWCLEITRRRVSAIVTNQDRGNYDQAAALAAACAEVLRKRGQPQRADLLLAEVHDGFPRHRAFQAELKAAVQRMRTNRF